MASRPVLIGELPIPELLDLAVPGGLREHPAHQFMEDKTLRGLTSEMRGIVVDVCLGHHELMEGEKRYQPRDCPRMRRSGACLHGEIWYSGLGVVHQGAIVANAMGMNPTGPQPLAEWAEELSIWDFKANVQYGEVRAGRVPLDIFQPKVEAVQIRIGTQVVAEAKRIADLLDPVLAMRVDAWLASRA